MNLIREPQRANFSLETWSPTMAPVTAASDGAIYNAYDIKGLHKWAKSCLVLCCACLTYQPYTLIPKVNTLSTQYPRIPPPKIFMKYHARSVAWTLTVACTKKMSMSVLPLSRIDGRFWARRSRETGLALLDLLQLDWGVLGRSAAHRDPLDASVPPPPPVTTHNSLTSMPAR